MASDDERVAANRARQRELYGATFGEIVGGLVRALGVTQAVLAETFGMSPAMLSQLVNGRRVKIGDPAVLDRLRALRRRCADRPVRADEVAELLAEVRRGGSTRQPPAVETPVRVRRPSTQAERAAAAGEALRAVTTPPRLVAAAATLAVGFPEIAALLRRAAAEAP